MKKLILIIGLILLLSACNGQDINTLVRGLPQVQEYLIDNPDEEIHAFYWNNETVEMNKEQMEENCGIEFSIRPYWFVTVGDMKVYIDGLTNQPLCVYEETKDNIIEEQITEGDIPVELFVMSHCPYGIQTEKAIIPVVKLLEGKVDFTLRFVSFAMHGEKEVNEQLIQYCLQQEYKNKFIDYLECFVEGGKTGECLDLVDVSTKDLKECIKEANEEFKIIENLENKAFWKGGRYPQFNTDKTENEKYSVTGSPTLALDNKRVANFVRSPDSLLKLICSRFINKPVECNEQLSTTTSSPGFGTSSGGTSSGSCN